jgi:hypothetical protein
MGPLWSSQSAWSIRSNLYSGLEESSDLLTVPAYFAADNRSSSYSELCVEILIR